MVCRRFERLGGFPVTAFTDYSRSGGKFTATVVERVVETRGLSVSGFLCIMAAPHDGVCSAQCAPWDADYNMLAYI